MFFLLDSVLLNFLVVAPRHRAFLRAHKNLKNVHLGELG